MNEEAELEAREEEAPAGEKTEEELLEECRAKLCAACSVAEEANAVKLRALAEMDNFKKRLQREKEEQARYAAEKVLADLLPTLDNLDLALQYGGQSEESRNMMVGVEMTRTMLLDALKKHGLVPVGQVGQAFDPNDHEAVGQEESEGMEAGFIVRVMQKGYRLNEHLLRPARVIVSR
ncbi:MAG TPA: nucleotide exchange factor GrpE [Mailhella massiliensis]|uniref:Protein GrpE n=2 Tax=Mailhella massiliensis TaxID=1903261 RepID=A0A921AXS0_9BACT|nr:nucleotide exchange factor GrpE [Mailhella massiliensis]